MNYSLPKYIQLILCAVIVVTFAMLSGGSVVLAQHEKHNKPKPTPAKPKAEVSPKDAPPQPEPANPQPKPKKDEMKDMPGMPRPEATAAPSPEGSPEASPEPVEKPARHEMPGMEMPATPAPGKAAASDKPTADAGDMSGMGAMNMGPLLVMSGNDVSIRVGASATNVMPMGQMGSGTSWAPGSSPMPMIHKQSGNWLLMFHFNATAGVNSQGGPRGITRFESANWFMPMAFRKVGPGTLQLRGMFSFEPFTFPPGGSPLLFQTGETYKARPLIDAQHPHDLLMELSATYTLPLGDRATWFSYVGYPGEPALGPTAFMHRASASENPSATLSHHLQDSSHISFGVFTTGFTYRWFKIEGSVFNGREPDENRYNLEAHPWTSRSARLSFALNNNWTMQVSHGLLRSPEALAPGDVRRTTASVSYNRKFQRGNLAAGLIWGRNHESHGGERANLNGYVAESTINFQDKNYVYTRLELVDKNQLLRLKDRQLLGITQDHPSFRIGAYTLGGARDIWNTDKLSVAIGSDLTFYSKPAVLDLIYGHPISWKLFLRVRPANMKMGDNHQTHPSH
jgi:hypothetical protein